MSPIRTLDSTRDYADPRGMPRPGWHRSELTRCTRAPGSWTREVVLEPISHVEVTRIRPRIFDWQENGDV